MSANHARITLRRQTTATTTVSVVNVAFDPLDDDQTLMSIEHSLLPPEEFDDYQNGWTLTSDQLAAVLPRSFR